MSSAANIFNKLDSRRKLANNMIKNRDAMKKNIF